MIALPLGPWSTFFYGVTKPCIGWVKRMGQRLWWVAAGACGRCLWDLRWGPLMWPPRAVLGGGRRMRAVPVGPS
eukprot:3422060-Pyramimonas_sp.AAC.1